MGQDYFYTIECEYKSEIKIHKSSFIANAFPCNSKKHSIDILNKIKKKYFDARHHPYAFRIGNRYEVSKFNDDGEPSGSSGKPILEAIDKYKLTNLTVVVTRYFGGVKLGVGGLKRAYFEAADSCLAKAEIIEKLITKQFVIETDYKYIGVLLNYIEKSKIQIDENYSDDKVKLIVSIRESITEKTKTDLSELTNGKINYTEINK